MSSWPGCSVGIFAVFQCSLDNPIGRDKQSLGALEMRILFDKDKSSFSDGVGLGREEVQRRRQM